MESTTITTLESQIAALQAQIDFLMGNRTQTPAKRLENIRRECRTKYFGTFDDIKEGKADYGPDGKWYSDYSAIVDIVRKSADMLYRYSTGHPNRGTAVSSLITSEDSMRAYETICEDVCKGLREKVDEYSKRN